MPDRPYLSVIIPFHNADRDLSVCLARLAGSSFSEFECLLVDDGSTVDPGEFLQAPPLPVLVCRTPSNRGPAVARNLGARMAKGEILLFLDADVCVGQGTLAQIVARFREDPALDALFGSYDDSPAAPSLISQFRNLLHCHTHQASPPQVHTFWAGCGAIRRQIFLDHGGFDERYDRPSIEDIEFGSRLAAAGGFIEIDRDIQVQHRKHWTLASMCRTDILARGIPWTRLVLERRHIPNQLSLRHGQRLSVLLTFAGLGLLSMAGTNELFPLLLALSFAMVIWLNRDFYRFLASRRGWLFTVQAFVLHLLYFCNCGLSLLLGVGAHCFDQVRGPAKKYKELRRPA